MASKAGESTALSDPYTQSVGIFRAVNVIGQQLSAAPLRVYSNGERVDYNPLQILLDRPNKLMRQAQFVRTISAQQLMYGNAYVYMDSPNSLGIPRALLPLHPEHVKPIRGKGAYELEGWAYCPPTSGGSSRTQRIPVDRMLHFPYAINPSDPLIGLSPIGVARLAYEADYSAAVYNKSIMTNSGVPAGSLRYVGEGLFDEDDAQLVRDQWIQTYGSSYSNPEGVAVLSADFEYTPLGINSRDMQWLEARRFNLAEIARVLNVPLLFLNEYETSGLSDAGLKIQWKLLHATNIGPNAKDMADVFTEGLTSVGQHRITIRFDFNSVEALQDDFAEKIENAKGYVDLGYSLNSVNRKFELGMEKVDHGDTVLVDPNKVPIDVLIESYENPPEPEEPEDDEPEPEPEPEEEPEEEEPEEEEASAVDPLTLIGYHGHTATITEIADICSRIGTSLSKAQARALLKVAGVREDDIEDLLSVDHPTILSKGEDESLDTTSLELRESPENEGLYLHSVAFSRIQHPEKAKAEEWVQRAGVAGRIVEQDHIFAFRPEESDGEEFLRHTMRITQVEPGIFITRGRLKRDYYPDGKTWTLPEWRRELADAHKERIIGKENAAYKAIRGHFHKQFTKVMKELRSRPAKKASRSLDEELLDQSDIDDLMAVMEEDSLIDAIGPVAIAAFFASLDNGFNKVQTLGIVEKPGIAILKERGPALSEAFYARRVPGWETIENTVKSSLKEALISAYEQGLSLNDAADEVKRAFKGSISTARSRVIAKTEIGIASLYAEYEAFASAGVTRVEWISANDGNVRDTHQIDGEVRPLGTPFSNGLERPLDPSGHPSEIINCRCIIQPVVN